MRSLTYGAITTTYRGWIAPDGSYYAGRQRSRRDKPAIFGYRCQRAEQGEVARAIFCVTCGVAVVELWQSSSTNQWIWCGRTGKIYRSRSHAAALRSAMQWAKSSGVCLCNMPQPKGTRNG